MIRHRWRLSLPLALILVTGGTGAAVAQVVQTAQNTRSLEADVGSRQPGLVDRRARLDVSGVSLAAALEALQERSGVTLAYSPSLLPADVRVSCNCADSTAGAALRTLLAGTGFTFYEAQGQVVLRPSRGSEAAAATARASSAAATAGRAGAEVPARRREPATVTGRVTSEDQVPVAGAFVTVRNGRYTAMTDARGEYRIVVPEEQVTVGVDTLRVSQIGYRPAAVPYTLTTGTVRVDVTLVADALLLDEIVVTGTAGNQLRRAQSAVIASVDAADIVDKAPVTSVTQVLEGRIPGVVVTQSSGATGTASRINIRGAASLSLSNEPLVFIDGVRMESGHRGMVDLGGQTISALNDLNPADIERIEVVKGPAAATLYGADASAGVIQIVTKKGRAGARRLSQNVTVGYDHIAPNFTPYTNYGICTAALVAPSSPNPLCRGQEVGTIVTDNPLERENAFRDGRLLTVRYSADGGGESYGYYASFSIDDEDGTTRENMLDRRTGQVNFTWTATDRLSLNASFGLLRTRLGLPQGDQSSHSYLLGAGLGSPLTVRDGPNGGIAGGWYSASQSVESIASILSEVTTLRTTPSIQIHYTPVAWLTHRLTVGADLNQSRAVQFYPKNDEGWYTGDQANGWVQRTRSDVQLFTIDYLGNIRTHFGEGGRFSSDLSFGSQYIDRTSEMLRGTGIALTTNSANLVTGAATRTAADSYSHQKSLGLFVQEQLGIDDRLFLQVGARVDRNSAFGSDVGSFFLPKAGVSYLISEEPFWDRFSSIVSTLRLRGAYGTTGRAPTPGASLRTYVSVPYVTEAGLLEPGLIPLNPGNADLRPERGTEFEAGFDAGLFNERVAVELTYFEKRTTDLMVQVPQPPSSGYTQGGASRPYQNIGEVLNRGFEFGVRATPVSRPGVTWQVGAHGSTLHNRLISLGGVEPFFSSYRAFMPGRPLGAWWVHRIRSVDVENGRVIVSDTAEYLGDQLPKLQASINTTLDVGPVRVYAQLDGKAGHRLYSLGQEYRDRFFQNSAKAVLPADQGGYSDVERLRRYGPYIGETSGQAIAATEVKEDYIQPGDFLRLSEISVMFSLPSSLVRRMGAGSASLTLSGRNLALWKKFDGYDPEVLGTGPGQAHSSFYDQFHNAEVFTTPPVRRWSARLSVQF